MKYLTPLIFAVIISLAACSGLNVEKTPLQQPQDSPEDARPAPIGFSKIRYSIPTGTPVRSHSPKGFFGLVTCGAPYGMEESGVSSRTFPNDDYRRVFLDTLGGEGYDVAGDPGRMFDEEEDEMRAQYAVGARVTDIKMDLCRKGNMWGAYRGETGEAALTIEWTVFDLLHRKNAYKTVTKGYAKQKMVNYQTVDLLLENAFAAAAHNLGADPEFHALVFYGEPPKETPDTYEDIHEAPESDLDPREKVSVERAPLSTSAAQGRFEDIGNVAVMVEAGGGHGSGFFITKDGHILTNAHVVGNADRVRVVTAHKEEKLIANVIRLDRKRDIALLKLDAAPEFPVKTLPIRKTDLSIGEDVYAIGAPHLRRMQDTVTRGIVSANRYDRERKQPYVQADVEIYPGSSGGPLLDANGNIIAISVSGLTEAQETSTALNLFIPIGDALQQLNIGVQ